MTCKIHMVTFSCGCKFEESDMMVQCWDKFLYDFHLPSQSSSSFQLDFSSIFPETDEKMRVSFISVAPGQV